MKWIVSTAAVALTLYSILLLNIELTHGQERVRWYLTDIFGPTRFWAINTTLSVALLWATALLFAVAARVDWSCRAPLLPRSFAVSQVIMFTGLGLDDRFLIHEMMKANLGLPNALMMAAAAVVEMVLLLALGQVLRMQRWLQALIISAGALFTMMVAIDALIPKETVLRLSVEDLSKTWASFCLFCFAWGYLEERLKSLLVDTKHAVPDASQSA